LIFVSDSLSDCRKTGKAPAGDNAAGATCFWDIWSLAFDDFAGLDAAGADAHTLADTVYDGLDGLQVYVPATAGGVVGVGDVVSELRAFAAEIALGCHDGIAPILYCRSSPAPESIVSGSIRWRERQVRAESSR
jgi:hypothetical protein